jgi:hypothetical protein
MSTLEQRYRRMLVLLPGTYRRGEEVLSTLMDGAGDGQRWPRLGEASSLVALAMRTRTGVLVPDRVKTASAPWCAPWGCSGRS